MLIHTHTFFSPYTPLEWFLLDHDLGHLVRAVLQVITSAPAPTSPVRTGLLVPVLHPVEHLLILVTQHTRQAAARFPR